MKEAIGGISLFQIVIVFILVFTGIMCLTINHSKAFGVKDELINIIETEALENPGVDLAKLDESVTTDIANRLSEVGYRITGECPDSSWIGYDRNGSETSGKEASFCIKANNVGEGFDKDLIERCKNSKCTTTNNNYPPMIYYDIALFYQLDIPVANTFFNFRVYGSTKVLFGR